MKIRISKRVEQLFAYAVSLSQNGGLKNTIYAIDQEIFILNYDHTVLLRFRLRDSEAPFSDSVSFSANDYDSDRFYEEDGKIIFVSKEGVWTRKKSCGTPDLEPETVREIFQRYQGVSDASQKVRIPRDAIRLLDSGLSHVEFYGETNGNVTMIQRNIYSGSIVEVSNSERSGILDMTGSLDWNFGPVGIKTGDLLALYSFEGVLDFTFFQESGFIQVNSINTKKQDMKGFLACCVYDEIIDIMEVNNNGRKKQEVRGRQQALDSTNKVRRIRRSRKQ